MLEESVVEGKVVLTERECAKRLGISFWTLRTLRIREKPPHILLGSRIYYVYDTLVDWLSQRSLEETSIRTS